MTIEELCSYLKLPYIANNYKDEVAVARRSKADPQDFLKDILFKEAEMHRENGNRVRIRRARFPYKKFLTDFKDDKYNSSLRREIDTLSNLDFIDNKENVILIGTPGTGKTHLAIGLGLKACLTGKTVLFVSVPDLVIEIHEAVRASTFTSYKKKFEKYDLIIMDELGYVSFSKDESELLFNLISSRYDRGSIIITTNLAFDRWSEVFGDTMVTSAMVDRLAFKAHILDMTLDTSYRYEQTIAWSSKSKDVA